MVMVGFNRRFSPHTVKLKELLAQRSEPLCMNMTVNAGFIPPDHWVHDPVRGGGRIIGEACHFIDLLAFLAGGDVESVSACKMGRGVAIQEDKMSIALSFSDGSVGTVNYFANGTKSYPKEVVEVFSDLRVFRLENFRRLVGYAVKGFKKLKTSRQDKGHAAEFAAFIKAVETGGPPLIPFAQLENITRAALAAVESAASGQTVHL
jgi:predicted dehydrogenase